MKKFVLSILLCLSFTTWVHAADADPVTNKVNEFIQYDQRPEKIAYLTFDDGPSIHTEKLLAVLKEYEVPAIFFVMGDSIDIMTNGRGEMLLNQILADGHHIGYHSMTHNRDRLYFLPGSPQFFVQEMLDVREKVAGLTGGYWSNLCRAPYGKKTHFQKGHWPAVEAAGLYCIDWNIDSLDWAKNDAGSIFNQVLIELEKEKYPDQIVLLFHEKDITAKTLPNIINFIRSRGYTFVPYVEGEYIEILGK